MKKVFFVGLSAFLLLTACNESQKEEKNNNKDSQTKDTVGQADSVQPERPQPMLGEAVQIMIGTKDYDRTVQFYQTLGWNVEKTGEEPWKWTSLYDGSTTVLVNEDTTNYMGPAYHSSKANDIFEKLAADNIEPMIEVPNEKGEPWFNVYFSPDTVGFSVIAEAGQPKETTTIADMRYNGGENLSFPNKVSGIFQEYAVSVENLDQSMAFWENLGFTGDGVNQGPPYKYTILYDGALVIGLHETNGMWYGQMLTYSGHGVEGNKKAVEALKAEGFKDITPLEYGGHVLEGNYIIHDPAGNMFFLTTDFSKMKK